VNGYHRIPRGDVPAWLREIADLAASEAAVLLGLSSIKIRWRSGPGSRLGWVDMDQPEEINLNAYRLRLHTAYEVKAILFHEGRHCWQILTGRWLNHQQAEEDAASWAYQRTGILVDLLDGRFEQ
jgi:hypothetical protein